MPHTTVTYTNELADAGALDFDAFATDLQSALVSIAAAAPQACRTRLTGPGDRWHIAGGTEAALPQSLRPGRGPQAVHVEIALKAGRSAEVKGELSQAVLDLVRKHLAPVPAREVHLSVEIRDMDPAGYVSHVEPRQDA